MKMPRGVHADTTDFYRAYISRGSWNSYYGPYNKPSTAKGIITRELQWSRNNSVDTKTGVEELKAFIGDDGKPYLAWEDMNGQLSFDDAV